MPEDTRGLAPDQGRNPDIHIGTAKAMLKAAGSEDHRVDHMQ
jgi:hypothetical protein